jgi:hypothetical protein
MGSRARRVPRRGCRKRARRQALVLQPLIP